MMMSRDVNITSSLILWTISAGESTFSMLMIINMQFFTKEHFKRFLKMEGLIIIRGLSDFDGFRWRRQVNKEPSLWLHTNLRLQGGGHLLCNACMGYFALLQNM